MGKLYIRTRNGKMYIIMKDPNTIRMTENDVQTSKTTASVVLTEMPKPRQGSECIFKFRGGKLLSDSVLAFYYA